MHGLALAWEAFRADYDDTTIDEAQRVVEIQRPDGKPDVLQQIEHGALTVVGGYRALGRFYRGIIVPTLRQYTHLGDFAAQTDNVGVRPEDGAPRRRPADRHGPRRLARRPMGVHRGEPAARARRRGRRSRPRRARCAGYDDALAAECLADRRRDLGRHAGAPPAPPRPGARRPSARLALAVELLLTTKDRRTPTTWSRRQDAIVRNIRADRLGRRARACRPSATPPFTAAVTRGGEGLPRRGAAAREEDALRRALRAGHLGRGLGHPGLRHAAVLPARRLPGRLPEGR